MSTQAHRAPDGQQYEFNKRLEEIGWALFLIMIGGLWLLPAAQVPEGAWLIGAGLIMLGVNAVRYVNGIRINSFTIVLGVLALAGGAGSAFGVRLPLFPLLLILIGGSIILKPLIGTRS